MSKKKQKKTEQKEPKQENNQIKITNGEVRAFFIPMNITDPSDPRFMSTPYVDLMTSEKAKDFSGKAKIKLMKLDRRVSEGVKDIETVRKGMLDKYCIKDKEGEPILKPPNIAEDPDKKLSPEEKQKRIDKIPKERWTHDFTEENRKLFDKEFKEMLGEDADIQGDRITLRADDLPKGLLNPAEMGTLSKIINFIE